MAHPTIKFPEVSTVKYAKSKYDISVSQIEEYKNLNSVDEMKAYNDLLSNRLIEYERLEKREFIYHHLDCVGDTKGWLFSMARLIVSRTSDTLDPGSRIWEDAFDGVYELIKDILDKNSNQGDGPFNKILTNLTVDEAGYWLRLLVRIEIYEPNSLSQLFKMFISQFITERKFKNDKMQTISYDSLRNTSNPSLETMEKILKITDQIKKEVNKDKKIYLG